MTPLEDLAPEQRAVLELVLRAGRSYDEIATMLRMDRAGVRERALSGFDALGPSTSVPAERRALITDYVLGQLPERVSEQVAQRLAHEPADRAWARVVAAELAPVAGGQLPPIPSAADYELDEPEFAPAGDFSTDFDSAPEPERRPDPVPAPIPGPSRTRRETPPPRVSRRGGAILLGAGLVVAVVVVVVVLVLSGGSSKTSSTTSASAGSSTSSSSTSASASTGTEGTTPKSLSVVKLTPADSSSKAQGEADVFLQSNQIYLAIVAIHLAANSHNYYAVWLTGGSGADKLIGFAPAVTSNGQLQAASPLTAAEGSYKRLLLTLETTAHPTQPGQTILTGSFGFHSP